MVDIAFDVGGSVNHRQSGVKTELGTASDHIVVYFDPDDMEKAKTTIERAMRLHQYAKELKAGLIPLRKNPNDPELTTAVPGREAK